MRVTVNENPDRNAHNMSMELKSVTPHIKAVNGTLRRVHQRYATKPVTTHTLYPETLGCPTWKWNNPSIKGDAHRNVKKM